MQDFFKYHKIQGGAPLFMKSDNDGSKDENRRGLPLGIKTTAQGIKHFTSWDNISNSIEARNTTRFDDAQPNSLRFSMNNARAAYDLVDGLNIYPVARPLEPEHGLLHREFSKVSFEDRWEANDITILDDIAFVSYEDYSDVHRHDIDLKNQDGVLRQASTSGLKARATSPATRGITKAKSMTWSPPGPVGTNYGSGSITASPAFLTEQR